VATTRKRTMQQATTKEVLHHVDELLRQLEAWASLSPPEPILPSRVEIWIEQAAATCLNAPALLNGLRSAVEKLLIEFRRYNTRAAGAFQADGGPGSAFWTAAKATKLIRIELETPKPATRDSVRTLREQGVSNQQIAFSIYGFREKGPFVFEDGSIDERLLDKEAASPGSVIPRDWVSDWERDVCKAAQQKMSATLPIYDRVEKAMTTRYEDPDTVETLLKKGAFVQQIMKAKHVTRSQVLAIAREIGIEPVDGPGYAPSADDDDDPVAIQLDPREGRRIT